MNILYILTDQQQADALSCAGNEYVSTPAADRLAAEGVRFTNAFCAQPVCVPSRCAMQTGRWPHANGVFINHGFGGTGDIGLGLDNLSGARPLLAQTLSEAGYETAYFGRWHIPLPTERPDLHGYGTVCKHDLDDKAIAPDFSSWLDQHGDGPFFAVTSVCDPHDICHWPRCIDEKLPDEKRVIPNGPIADAPAHEDCPPLPENFKISENEPSIIREFQDFRAPHYRAPYFNEDQWQQYRWAYWRFVEKADLIIARILKVLDERNLRKDTVIVFASDHGEGAASHRWCQKQALYRECTQVPFIIAPPGCSRAGETEERLVSAGIDLYPTLCEYAEIKPLHWLHGRSVKPLAEGETVEDWPDFIAVETEFHGSAEPIGARGRMIRTDEFNYAAFSRGEPAEQLYDLKKDPGEIHNVALEPEYADVLSAYRGRLKEWCERYDDFFVKHET